jgi:uncharacterized protein (DUF1330 family)
MGRTGVGDLARARRFGVSNTACKEHRMAAYVIVEVDVTDPGPYEEYKRGVPATLEKYDGRFVVRGGRYETLEGEWQPQRIVVLEFPSFERARQWHASPEYQAILPIRQRHARTRFLTVVEGV